jgi:zinc protease
VSGALRLALAWLAVIVAASPVAADAPVVRHVLPNGMRILVRENHASAIVAMSLLVGGGTRLERPDTAGITNFLQRVMLRGTPRRSALALAEAAEDLGGSLDASGDVDHGEIRGQALARHANALLGLLAEVALDPALRSEDVERERRLILAQIASRQEAPFTAALDALLSDLYGPHPYGLPLLGRRASIERIGPDALAAHYRTIYRPENLVLAVSGDVPAEPIVRRAGRLFGALAGGARVEERQAPAPVPTRQRRLITGEAAQAQVLVGFPAPPFRDPDHAAVRLLGAVLGGGVSSRLFVEVRDRQGLAYSQGVQVPTRIGPSWLVAYVGTAVASAGAAETAVLREIERARTEPPSEDEVARAKAYVLGTFEMDRRTNARQASSLAFYELAGAGWDFPARYRRAIESVTVTDVADRARRYLTHPTAVVLLPAR